MGYICHKFFLVILRSGDLACHIVQTCGKIAYLIVTFHLKFIVHISFGILFRSIRNFSQRYIYDFREKDQDDQRE